MNVSCMDNINININCNNAISNNQIKNTILPFTSPSNQCILPLSVCPLPPPPITSQPPLMDVCALQKALTAKTNELKLTQSVLCNFLNSTKNPISSFQNNMGNNEDGKQFKALQSKNDQLSKDLKIENDKNAMLESELHSLRCTLHEIEQENRCLSKFKESATAKQNVLNELYLNANRIKKFMASIRKYGKMFDQVKKKQFNLTKCVGMEDVDTFKIRMNDLYDDITHIEQSYHRLYESIDVIKTESQGKELELMTKDREMIGWLEKEYNVQSQHLDEIVKKNQSLQTDLTDREMRLRQTTNALNFTQQKLLKLQNENNHLYDRINGIDNANNGIQFITPHVTDQYML